MLATATVCVSTSDGRELTARALIDQGAQSSFVSQNFARKLKIDCYPANVTVSGIGGIEVEKITSYAILNIRSRFKNSSTVKVKALIMKKVTSDIPPVDETVKSLDHFKNLDFADDSHLKNQSVELILGAEVFSLILKSGVRMGRANEPIAQETSFGWILSGQIGQADASQIVHLSIQVHNASINSLDAKLQKFWQTEEISAGPFSSADDIECEQFFQTTTKRDPDGRFQVRIPFKTYPPDLGESYFKASKQYQHLEARFNREPDLAEKYHEFLEEYLKLNHMAPDSAFSDNPPLRYYVPHHAILRPSSTTTKLRVVFNASAKSENGKSLNECMFAGPKLQKEIFDILLRARTHPIVCFADIEKMFRQINIAPEDTPFLCILWKPPKSNEILVYRLTTVTYGTAAAPYLSMRVLKQLALDEASRYPRAAVVLLNDIFVDDVICGADTVEQCKDIRDELIAVLRAGGFSLRKWESNNDEVLADLPDDLRARKDEKKFEETTETKVLGLKWIRKEDQFSFDVKMQPPKVLTKRSVLSIIASIFDPLGLVAPAVVLAKIFMQNLWREKLDWDTELSAEAQKEWSVYFQKLQNLEKIRIPRWIGTHSYIRTWEIHGFADASQKAFAAVVYAKCETSDGPGVTLLTSKTRVAPLQELTIPRLELNAAVTLAKLLSHVRQTLKIEDIPITCWSDSSIVLHWLQTCPSKLNRFVANRVWTINETLPAVEWRHVPTQFNPADVASRGALPNELASHKLWWSGPPWLVQPRATWPENITAKPDEKDLELKTRAMNVHVTHAPGTTESIAHKYSSWKTLMMVTALFKRLAARTISANRVKKGEDPLPVESLAFYVRKAKEFWICYLQSQIFEKEIQQLKRGQDVQNSAIRGLKPFLDKNDILRVRGRLTNAGLPYAVTHPIILGPHHLTTLLVSSVHHDITWHGGKQLMMRVIREEYEVLKLRNQIKACINKCSRCIRYKPPPLTQIMGDLPADRVQPADAFLKTAVDYCGPFLTRDAPGRGKKTRKGWVAVFVCLVTRAIHLELVSDCSTACFLAAFRRFTSLCRVPEKMVSDNGSAFKGADRELRNYFRELHANKDVESFFANKGVEWKFHPPGAPNFSGLAEAGVKSVKHHLNRVVNNQLLTFEEMLTLLYQIRTCLQDRSLQCRTVSMNSHTSRQVIFCAVAHL